METATEYLYWCFLDEDAQLRAADVRAFERQLLHYEPAVGVPKIAWNPRVVQAPVLPIYHFDAIFNAFHRETLYWLLPYNGSFDNSCWWTSQLLLIHRAAMWYQGHVLQFDALSVGNTQHRAYPRVKHLWPQLQREFGESLPPEMRACYSDKGHLGMNVTTKSLLWGEVRRKDGSYSYPPSLSSLRQHHPHYQFENQQQCQLYRGPVRVEE
jgi:hypothetical protein